jgi:hypothetical protein
LLRHLVMPGSDIHLDRAHPMLARVANLDWSEALEAARAA